jgi:hypothetical protein
MVNLPSFATLNQTRPDSGIAEESRFQGLGISTTFDFTDICRALSGLEAVTRENKKSRERPRAPALP